MRLRLLGCVHRTIPSQNPTFAPPSAPPRGRKPAPPSHTFVNTEILREPAGPHRLVKALKPGSPAHTFQVHLDRSVARPGNQ